MTRCFISACRAFVVLVGGSILLASPGAAQAGDENFAGVENPRRAWQNWALNCQGCHRPDATGTPNATPNMAGEVARFLSVPGGRAYLGQVPGVATSPLNDDELAELVNWMLPRFDAAHMPEDFTPFTAEEITKLRARPLRTDASRIRADLIARMTRDRP